MYISIYTITSIHAKERTGTIIDVIFVTQQHTDDSFRKFYVDVEKHAR